MRPPCAAQPFRAEPQLIAQASPRATGHPFVRLWRVEDYDGGSLNYSVVQHPVSGYIYIGNSDGVLEFDGARWQLIALPKKGAVETLVVDSAGRVWAGGTNEIARLEPDGHGRLHAVTVVADLPDGELAYTGEALAAPDGVWFGGRQHILRIGANDAVATWDTAERFGSIWWMEGGVHTSVSDREVLRLAEGGKTVSVLSREEVPAPGQRPNPLQVFAARSMGGGDWQLLTALGPVRWRSNARSWRVMPEAMPFFRDGIAVGAMFLADGGMAFSMARPGVALCTAEGRLERVIDRMPLVLGSRLTHLAEDAEGGLWLPGAERIVRLDLRRRFARQEGAQNLQGNPRQVIRHNGQLLVAHSEGVSGYNEWQGRFAPAVNLLRGAGSLASVGVDLFAAAAGLVAIHDDLGTRVLSNLGVTTLAAARSGPPALFAGDARGVWIFEPDGRGWSARGRLENVTGAVASMFDAGDGWLWGASPAGRIWRADIRQGRRLDAPVRVFGENDGVPAVPPGARVQFFSLGNSVVATCVGWLLRYDAASDRFVPETRIAGFTDASRIGAEAIASNDDGACWLRLGPPDRRLLHVLPDGPNRFRAQELAAPILRDLAAVSLYEDPVDHTLWISGADVLISADLDWRTPRPPPMPVAHLRRVSTDTGEILWGETLRTGASLALDKGQTSLRFEFTTPLFGPDHRGRPLAQYRTRLDGLDSDWTAWSAEPRRDFTNLPYRAFTFHVQARDATGRMSDDAMLPFVIEPPWWLARWMVAGYAILGVCAIGGLVRLRTRVLRRQTERLENVVAQRTAELAEKNSALVAQNEELARLRQLEMDEKIAARLAEEKARLEVLRYQLNPHFLYNALNSVYGLVLTAPGAAADMVLRLADFCRAALTRNEEDTATVEACFEKLSLYLDIEKARWKDSLRLEVTIEDAARDLRVPPFLLQPLVENAIKYGGSTSPDELGVRMSARVEESAGGAEAGTRTLVFEVANTGEWVEPAAARARGNTGLGLENLRQRLERTFPGRHELTTEQCSGWVIARLKLIVTEAAPRLPAS